MLAFWGLKMQKYKENIINLHWCILVIIVISLLECLLRWGIFSSNNMYGTNNSFLLFLQVLVEVCRDTFSRVITLLVSLGYGILIKTIEKYQTKVFFLTFFYMASLSALLGVAQINHYQPVRGVIIIITLIPNMCLNATFSFWIYLALRRTLNYLVTKDQRYKFIIISKIFVCLCVCILATFILMIVQIFTMMSGSRDADWKVFWVWEACWFFIFTCFMVSIVFILQPNESSDLLTQMEELLDETLHEMPTQEIIDEDDLDMDDIELHHFGLGKEQSDRERLDSYPDVIYQVRESEASGMTMEEFSEMKRDQRRQKESQAELSSQNMDANDDE